MSGIAHVLHDRGHIVSGSDRQESDNTRRLRALGIQITVGHEASNVNGADVVVFTPAVPDDNPELVEARQRGIPVMERPEMLGLLMEPCSRRVAVAGTHGKTTTTSMISVILVRAGIDATVLIGGDLAAIGGNVRIGDASVIVAEACEAFESFLRLRPTIAVITNIDADHLDHYGTVERVEESFRRFAGNVTADGCVIANADDERVRRVLKDCGRRVVWFGLSGSPDLLAGDVDVSSPHAAYTLVEQGHSLGRVRLGVPGRQNIADSLAAAGAAFELGAEFEDVQEALRRFHGAGRRFEVLFDDERVLVIDDYAHHPAEIRATLEAARSAYPDRRIIAVFQPHLYSRTAALLDEFADSLLLADEAIVTSIYAAREAPMEGVNAQAIVTRMKERGFSDAAYLADKSLIPAALASRIRDGDLVIVLGAGDIRQVGEELASMLRARKA